MLSRARVPEVERRSIAVCADPCGVAHDPSAGVLYVADAYTGAILCVDHDRQHRIATIEAGGALAGDRIGGLARAPHGTLFATVIGNGRAGAIVRVELDGRVEPIDGLPPQPRRLGVTYDAREHALYTTQHQASRHGPHDGSIVAIDLVTGAPSTVLDGFARPVGIAKLGSLLVVTDARQRAVFRVELVAGRAVRRLQLAGDIDRPDSVCACGADSVLVTAYDDDTRCGSVHRIWLDGRRAAIIARGPWEPRGVATDGVRAFVATRRSGRVLVLDL